MAIIDKSKKPNFIDRNTDIHIGLQWPLKVSGGSEGMFESTKLSIDATRVNIKNLLSTERGERLYQPNLGLGLKQYLFQPVLDDDIIETIQGEIVDTLKIWLPHVVVENIQINFRERERNTMYIDVEFTIIQDPNTLEHVGIDISDTTNGER